MIEFTENNGRRVIRFDFNLKRFYVYKSTYSREVNMMLPLAECNRYKNKAMAIGHTHKEMYHYIKTETKSESKNKPKTKTKKVSKPKGMFIKI